MGNAGKKNWFERNPRKTIFVLLLSVFLGMTYAAEKLLAYKNQTMGLRYPPPNRAIRLRENRPSSIESFIPRPEDFKNHEALPFKEYVMRVDKNGFIKPSQRYNNPDISIVFLGGSSTECRHGYVEEEDRFPYLSAVLLEKRLGIKINSYNAARSGNHSLHSLDILLNKVLPIKPKIAVMMHNINDLVILLYEKSYWNQNSTRSLIIDINKEISVNFFKTCRDRLIPNLSAAMRQFDYKLRSVLGLRKKKSQGDVKQNRDEFAGSRGKRVVVDKSALVDEFEMNLQTYINVCRARRIIPVLMTMASRLKEDPDKEIAKPFERKQAQGGLGYQEFKELFDRFNESIRRKATGNKVLLIDLAREIPPTKDYLFDLVHFNNRGSIKAAGIISKHLRPLMAQELHQ